MAIIRLTSAPKILVSGTLTPTHTNTLLDSRTICNTLDELYAMKNPAIGLRVYVVDENRTYTIIALKPKLINGILVEDAAVDVIEQLDSAAKNMEFKEDLETLLIK